ncbi:MGH1-like glycoside hydrolase domain-containing protein [Flagellimonas allohymeniacidonis]|uniref:Glycoside hydrolase n=1 Tax=Flagellimonas allohymeniacidonis TaxID=2517819 RepID=A0A4V2HSD0_9FLAO|nr:trehalase family glycosidase [Allomuricauda hymeniacidonis]TAI47270.1 glycoside hydrolase [Allomuricauda hymeniacidonis]
MKESLVKQAIEVLENNHQDGGFTIPAQGLYPFQWKWDSGFIAIGYAHYDMGKAMQELASLLNAQWGNGFIPHIVFHYDSDTYFPGPDFHRSQLHPLASKKLRSTGLVQPPVLGFVLEKLYEVSNRNPTVLGFIDDQIDKVYENHVYFYENRDINNEGLVYIYHNWESGTDNSPMWDDIWPTMNPPEYEFERKDTTHVDPSQRPTKREYDHYLYIIEIAKQYNYDDAKIAQHSPFLVLDPLFNAMLLRSNEALIKLYGLLKRGEGKAQYLKEKHALGVQGMNTKLYHESSGAYLHFDLRSNTLLPYISSSSFAPLYAGVPSGERAQQLIQTLKEKFGGEDKYLCASFDPTHEKFNPKKYWRGPVWINMNWIIYQGLKRYGFEDLATRVKNESIELVAKHSFYEYFDCRKVNPDGDSNAYGGNNFSWTASLLIDFLNED